MTDYRKYTDQELVAFLQESDKSAFTEIFNRYHPLLYSHVFGKLREEAESMDIVQDIFVVLWEKRSQIRNINLAGFLFTMVRNRILNLLSHHKIVSNYEDTIKNYINPTAPAADELVREHQLAEIIKAEIAALPPRMREIFEMSRYENMSNKEIAAQLNLSEHTVADQMKKALKTLRLKIGLSVLLAMLMNQ